MTQQTPKIRSLPTERTVIYPESDGKPMAETDIHRKLMTHLIEMLENHDVNEQSRCTGSRCEREVGFLSYLVLPYCDAFSGCNFQNAVNSISRTYEHDLRSVFRMPVSVRMSWKNAMPNLYTLTYQSNTKVLDLN